MLFAGNGRRGLYCPQSSCLTEGLGPLRSSQVFISPGLGQYQISPSAIPFDTPVTGMGGAGQKPFGRCPNKQGTFYEGASLIMHISFMHRYFFLAKDNVLVYYVLYYKKLLLTFVIASKSSLYMTQNSCVIKYKFWRVQIVCWLLVSFSPLSSLQSRKRWGSGVNYLEDGIQTL